MASVIPNPNVAKALKRIRSAKTRESFMIVKIEHDYKHSLLLPHSQGVALLNSMAAAERFLDYYNEPKRVVPLATDTVSTRLMSYDEYEQHKLAALLNINFETAKEMMEAAEALLETAST